MVTNTKQILNLQYMAYLVGETLLIAWLDEKLLLQ